MLKRELKVNFKSFVMWCLIIVSMLIMVFAIYPSMSANMEMIDELILMFPKEVLKIFNMDIVSISTIMGWLLTEGYLFVLLLGGCYAAILGSNILLKEESDKTIDFLLSKPISKNKIVLPKMLTGFIYITLFNVVIALVTFVGLKLLNDFSFNRWFYFSVGPYLVHLVFFYLSMLLSMSVRKTSKSIGISIGLVLGSYLIQVIGKMAEVVKFLKYLSPFEYVDSRFIIENGAFPINYIVILFSIMVFAIALILYLYNRREFL